jgi:flagellar FliJ protein
MTFKFSLDPVLKVRDHQKKVQKQKLAKEVANKQEIQNLQEQVQQKLKGFLEKTEQSEMQNIHTLRQRASHMQQVHQKMKQLSEQLSKADKNVDNARSKLAEAHKNLHIMEKMKEFERSEFDDEVARVDQKFMDEIATQSYSQ